MKDKAPEPKAPSATSTKPEKAPKQDLEASPTPAGHETGHKSGYAHTPK